MRILVIDQCSGSKDIPDSSPEFEEQDIDEHGREGLLERENVPAITARKLYTGRQQGYIDSAVDILRAGGDSVDRMYISAGFGLVGEETELPPYNVTFGQMDNEAIRHRADLLEIPSDVREVVNSSPPYDLVVFALGSDYYRACNLESTLDSLPAEANAIVFNQEALADKRENVLSLSARTSQAKEHGTIVVALKGLYLRNFAENRGQTVEPPQIEELVEMFTTEPTTQTGLGEYD